MTHPFNAHRHHGAASKRADEHLSEYAAGGETITRKAMAQHDRQLHPGKHTKLKFADGGGVEGEKGRSRYDRGGRRGKSGKGSHVVVNVVPGEGGGPRPVPVPVPGGPPPMAGPPPMMPPRPMVPPGGPPMPPPGMPPGGPPGMPMRKAGGRVGHASGGRAKKQMGGPMMAPAGLARPMPAATVLRKGGGRAKHADGGAIAEAARSHAESEPKMPHMEAGAKSALGRMEKEKALGGFKRAVAAGD